ncbi:MAG: ABC transporter substrate-binding protein [Chloroflexi bacterium]|nr:ABC transporter substrate-binding protein [Chloroflexota bacterium]
MKRMLLSALALLLVLLAVVNCTRRVSETPATPAKPTPGGVAARPEWQQRWETTLAKAKEEGTVSIINTVWSPRIAPLIGQAFKEKYGINLENTPTARGTEMVAKIKAEQSAGLYLYDFFGLGSTTALTIMRPDGLLGPIEPLLILPETKDPAAWRGNKLPFLDQTRLFLAMGASKQPFITINTTMIKQGEITSYEDLLKPQYQGKMTINDPTVPGVGITILANLSLDVWDKERTKDFLTRLVRDQKVVIERDNRVHVESVARGKYAIALSASPETVSTFLDAGAPLALLTAREGTPVTSAAAGASVPTRMAHPNAGVVFLNWLLTKEGQSVLAKAFGFPSTRADASTEGIHSVYLFQPGEKLFIADERYVQAFGEWTGLSKQIIEAASK